MKTELEVVPLCVLTEKSIEFSFMVKIIKKLTTYFFLKSLETVSGFGIDYIKIIEKSGYNVTQEVKYVTNAKGKIQLSQ